MPNWEHFGNDFVHITQTKPGLVITRHAAYTRMCYYCDRLDASAETKSGRLTPDHFWSKYE